MLTSVPRAQITAELLTALTGGDANKIAAKAAAKALKPHLQGKRDAGNDDPANSEAAALVDNAHVRKILLYLLAPRSPQYFTDAEIQLLQPCFVTSADGAQVATSKKDPIVRHNELVRLSLTAMLRSLLPLVPTLVRSKLGSQLCFELLREAHAQSFGADAIERVDHKAGAAQKAAAEKTPSTRPPADEQETRFRAELLPITREALQTVAAMAGAPGKPTARPAPDKDKKNNKRKAPGAEAPAAQEELHVMEHPAAHILIKRLLLSLSPDAHFFARALFTSLSGNADGVVQWALANRGAFVLESLLERAPADVQTQLVALLAAPTAKKRIAAAKSPGATALLALLQKVKPKKGAPRSATEASLDELKLAGKAKPAAAAAKPQTKSAKAAPAAAADDDEEDEEDAGDAEAADADADDAAMDAEDADEAVVGGAGDEDDDDDDSAPADDPLADGAGDDEEEAEEALQLVGDDGDASDTGLDESDDAAS